MNFEKLRVLVDDAGVLPQDKLVPRRDAVHVKTVHVPTREHGAQLEDQQKCQHQCAKAKGTIVYCVLRAKKKYNSSKYWQYLRLRLLVAPPSPFLSMCLSRMCVWASARSSISTRNDSFTDHGFHDKHIKVESRVLFGGSQPREYSLPQRDSNTDESYRVANGPLDSKRHLAIFRLPGNLHSRSVHYVIIEQANDSARCHRARKYRPLQVCASDNKLGGGGATLKFELRIIPFLSLSFGGPAHAAPSWIGTRDICQCLLFMPGAQRCGQHAWSFKTPSLIFIGRYPSRMLWKSPHAKYLTTDLSTDENEP
ncbi:hypothetical protein MSG28_010506 [Choristoneura fumiferana]|uniref:Uncharacterized protein n=1 Tax=Choristoneura fumiferana TaxID=7141 RepID=A0ACC0KLL8_CHOFU|nr:hypothetical protein MSG28_010506 [Choristoneura fumiferana]